MLSLHHLSVSINKKLILKQVNLELLTGTTYALMGPNGSGKSTLAMSILGNPTYTILRGSQILLDGKNITRKTPDERARFGFFLSFQNPLALTGVSVKDLLRMALEKKYTPLELSQKIIALAKELKIKDELLTRSLHDGFSGGEKKKLEALQAVLLAPKIAFFDEIDTGVDVDALKIISQFLKKYLPKETTLVFITHSTRLLKYLKPQRVLVMKSGEILKEGTVSLAQKIEVEGFDWIHRNKKLKS